MLPSGRKSYVVHYRAGRQSRRISLGLNTVLTCEQARNREDPAAKRDAGQKAITVKELSERFDEEHISIRLSRMVAGVFHHHQSGKHQHLHHCSSLFAPRPSSLSRS